MILDYVFNIPGDATYPKARQGGLSKLGHTFPEIERIIVVKNGARRHLMVWTNAPMSVENETALTTKVGRLIDVAYLDNSLKEQAEADLAASRNKAESNAKALLFFERSTFV